MDILPARPAMRRRTSSRLLVVIGLLLAVAIVPGPQAYAEESGVPLDGEAIQPLESNELIADEGDEELKIPTPTDFERIETPTSTTTDLITDETEKDATTDEVADLPADEGEKTSVDEAEDTSEAVKETDTATDSSITGGGNTVQPVIAESMVSASQEILPPAPPPVPPPPPLPPPPQFPDLPDNSGHGRRVVYSNSLQRVWLVEEDGTVSGSWLVSGRRGTPRAGHYRVFSRSRHARSVAGARMEYMIRFARGRRLAIGFHSIPIGRRGPLQSESELGQYRSAGCVRQHVSNAEHLWNWAGQGTSVVVTR